MEICGGGELERAGIVTSLFASPLYFNQTSCVSPLAATFISALTMLKNRLSRVTVVRRPLWQFLTPQWTTPVRFKRYEAFDAQLDQDALAEARDWYQTFEPSQLPKGNTTYARSSGPGGQHVNK